MVFSKDLIQGSNLKRKLFFCNICATVGANEMKLGIHTNRSWIRNTECSNPCLDPVKIQSVEIF